MKALEIIRQAQAILGRYLPPDGITQDQAINELLELLDGPEAVALTWEPSRPMSQAGLLEVQRHAAEMFTDALTARLTLALGNAKETQPGT